MNQSKKIIAVTGGVGSGKSSVCEILNGWGYPVIDCDEIGKEVADIPETLNLIIKEFGAEFVSNGKLNRKELGARVFKSEADTEKLNDIFHAQVLKILKERLSMLDGLIFVEVSVPKALPKGIADQVWEVTASPEIRAKRVMFRDNVRNEQVQDLMARQNYILAADETIDNNGYIDDTKARLAELIEKLK